METESIATVTQRANFRESIFLTTFILILMETESLFSNFNVET